MTGVLLAGCLLLAYGPSAAVLLTYASRRSALLILTIASAFCWLISIFLTSVIWIAIPPLREAHAFTQIVGVVIQEAVRWVLVYGYIKSEKAADQLIRRGGPKIFNDLSGGISAGLGFGTMHTVMMYGALLGASGTEAAFYLDSCPQISMFAYTAVIALFYSVLHVALMIIAIDAYRRGSRALACLPLALHLLFGLLTLVNAVNNGCTISLPLLAVVDIAAVVVVWGIERNPNYTAKRQQRAWELLAAGQAGPTGRQAPGPSVSAAGSTNG